MASRHHDAASAPGAATVEGARGKEDPKLKLEPEPEDDEEEEATGAELPLTMSASVVLAELPRDAAAALASAGDGRFGQGVRATATSGSGDQQPRAKTEAKVVVRFKPVGAALALGQDVCKITATRRFEEVVRYLRRKLGCKHSDSVFLYVNSAFAPSLDEVVGNLHRCFKNAQDQLVVAYSMTPAFG